MAVDLDDVASIVRLLSPERLEALRKLTGSDADAIELHQETLRLGAALMHVVATLEIALRNAVCRNLEHYFAQPNWLTQTPISFQWREPERKKIEAALDSARRAEYSKMSQAKKATLDKSAYPHGRPPGTSHLKRSKDRRKRIDVSEGKVVAELTLYFWKRLFGPDYEQTLWRTTLKRTFPFKKLTRAEVAAHLEKIYQARNRLAHHEPVIRKRFDDTLISIRFISQSLEAHAPSADMPLARLMRDDVIDVRERAARLHARLDFFSDR